MPTIDPSSRQTTIARDPFPRGQCPRCGQDVALVRDQSRTMVHGCTGRLDDDLDREYHGSPIVIALDMATGVFAECLRPDSNARLFPPRTESLAILADQIRHRPPAGIQCIQKALKTGPG